MNNCYELIGLLTSVIESRITRKVFKEMERLYQSDYELFKKKFVELSATIFDCSVLIEDCLGETKDEC